MAQGFIEWYIYIYMTSVIIYTYITTKLIGLFNFIKKNLIAKTYKKIYKIKILMWRKYSYLMNADITQCSNT